MRFSTVKTRYLSADLQTREIPKRISFDSRTQNIFRTLLNLGRVGRNIEGVLGRFAPQNTFYNTYNSRKFQKNSKNILSFWNPNVLLRNSLDSENDSHKAHQRYNTYKKRLLHSFESSPVSQRISGISVKQNLIKLVTLAEYEIWFLQVIRESNFSILPRRQL